MATRPQPENRRRRKKKKRAYYVPLAFLVICAAMIFGMSVFFRVSEIEVTGASMYTDEEIIAASGLEVGDNLFFINSFSASSKIISKLSYIDESRVTRHLPGRIEIEVSESTAAAYVRLENEVWIIDSNCKILSKGDSESIKGLIRVDGVSPSVPMIGDVMTAEDGESVRVEYLAEILRGLSRKDMLGDVSMIDVSNIVNPSFEYMDRFTVKMGKLEDIDYKFELLGNTISKFGADDSGIIDLSIDKTARFMPY